MLVSFIRSAGQLYTRTPRTPVTKWCCVWSAGAPHHYQTFVDVSFSVYYQLCSLAAKPFFGWHCTTNWCDMASHFCCAAPGPGCGALNSPPLPHAMMTSNSQEGTAVQRLLWLLLQGFCCLVTLGTGQALDTQMICHQGGEGGGEAHWFLSGFKVLQDTHIQVNFDNDSFHT